MTAFTLQGQYHLAILGDLNTMGHGIARWSPNFCCDKMRFRNLGWTEAQVWDDIVIKEVDVAYLPAGDGKSKEQPSVQVNERLKAIGLDKSTCADALNPGESYRHSTPRCNRATRIAS